MLRELWQDICRGIAELNWYTLRVGWKVIVCEPEFGRTRLVWENRDGDVRQEYVKNRD